jgi:hypothetical protein
MRTVAFGDVVRTTFTSTRRWRAYKFAGRTGQKVDLYLDGLRGLDTVLYLYKVSRVTGRPFGQPLAGNDDTENPGWTVRSNTRPNPLSSNVLAFTLPEDRNYALVATTYRQLYSGEAEVVVKASGRIQCAGLRAYEPCPEGMICEIAVANACGGADLPGYCEPRPSACADIYAPVCGCDGRTYGNDCERKVAGVQLNRQGPCGREGDPCSDRWACGEGLVCKGGACRTPEWCESPQDCSNLEVAILCLGAWSCERSACVFRCGAGDVGAACGSRGLGPCAEGLYCSFPASAQCGAADAPGTCQRRPQICTMQYDPVCGCDGRTHGNACSAASAGVSVAYRGECR